MKFAYEWLKRHLDTEKSVFEIAETLTSIGIEVEEIIDNYSYLKDFTVATVIKVEKHKDADHLKVCTVDTIDGIVTIVTGAHNVTENKKYPLAKVGTFIPNGEYVIDLKKLRGIESNGMLCSSDEINLPCDDVDGLMELSDKFTNGMNLYDALNLHDYIIDVSITPNRGDCFGIRGLAKDLAAKGVGKLREMKIPSIRTENSFPFTLSSDEFVANTCPIFSAIAVRNIHNVESPDWLKNFLISAGLKPKNVIVDVTNFLAIDLARPLHAYDINLIGGNNLSVRYSNDGTEFKDLKGNTHKLNDAVAVLADEISPLSIIGIIGGERTMCSLNTTDIILEAVYLNPEKIMATGQYLNIQSDARTRFERGTDPESVILGLKIAADMIVNICGGEVSEIVTTSRYKALPTEINFKVSDFEQLIGFNLGKGLILDILQKLGCRISELDSESFIVIPPSSRHDIKIKEDLIEEIARIVGYDTVKEREFLSAPINVVNGDDELMFKFSNSIRKFLASNGYNETVNYSFISKKDKDVFFYNQDLLEVANPISSEFQFMRPSLVPNILNIVSKMLNHGEREINLFEFGKVYHGEEESTNITCVAAYPDQSHNVWNDKSEYGIFDIKRDLLTLLEALNIDISNVKIKTLNLENFQYMHLARTAVVSVNGIDIAMFGELNPKVAASFGVKTRVFIFDFEFDKFFANRDVLLKRRKNFINNKLQKIYRDFAFVFDKDIVVEDVKLSIKSVHKQIVDIVTFDIYKDEILGDGKVSMAFNVEIEQSDKTLTESEIQDISSKVIKNVGKLGGILRA